MDSKTSASDFGIAIAQVPNNDLAVMGIDYFLSDGKSQSCPWYIFNVTGTEEVFENMVKFFVQLLKAWGEDNL